MPKTQLLLGQTFIRLQSKTKTKQEKKHDHDIALKLLINPQTVKLKKKKEEKYLDPTLMCLPKINQYME